MPVLVVEDDRAIRESITDLLEEEGFVVEAAKSVEEALDILARGTPPCVILLDLMMPHMDGRHLLATLKADRTYGHIPVVVMTAARVFEAPGAEAILRKPFSVGAVLGLVEQHCHRASERPGAAAPVGLEPSV